MDQPEAERDPYLKDDDPLLAAILDNPVIKTRNKLLDDYQKKLASLKFPENCTTSLIRVAAA